MSEVGRSRIRALGLLTTLYVAQGVPFGFCTQTLPVLLRLKGASLPLIGLAHLLMVPWSLKFLVAPWMDRRGAGRGGKRRGVIVPLQWMTIVTCLILGTMDATGQLQLLMLGVFLLNLFAATQDVATDGLAVELVEDRDRGVANGIQVGGFRIGMILGGGVLLGAAHYIGWAYAFAGMAALLALTTLPIARFREPPSTAAPLPGPSWGAVWDWFRRPTALKWLGVVALYKAGDGLGSSMLRPMLVDQGVSVGEIAWILGTVASASGLLGALLGGLLAAWWGRRRALLWFGLTQAAALGAYAVLASKPSLGLTYALCTLEHFTGGLATVSLFAAMMDATRKEVAATDYTLQACVQTMATGIASTVSGFPAELVGYPGHFMIAAAISVAGVGAAWLVPYHLLATTGTSEATVPRASPG